MNGRERILALLENRPVDRLPLMPITMTFASELAGIKYGPYAADHRVLVETQIDVSESYGFDHVSCISDPGREAADCGAKVAYFDDQPPAIIEDDALLGDKAALARLKTPNPLGGGRMHDRVRAVAAFKERIGQEKFIEGWVEGPCAEGADLRGMNALMMDFYDDPSFVRDLFEFVVEMELQFGKVQIEAGADIIGLGDAAASLVGPDLYDEFIWPYEKRIVDGLHALGGRVRLHICGNTRHILEGMGKLGCEIVDLDWLSPVSEGRERMGPEQVLLGNIDPVRILKNGTPEIVTEAVAQSHREAGARCVIGAGCEVPPSTPPENLRAMVEYAHNHLPTDTA